MILGVDDTDSEKGMCTTYLAPVLCKGMAPLVPLSPPALVRLNPNIPWRTRGNGAVRIIFGKPKGKPVVFGEWNGEPLEFYPKGDPDVPMKSAFDKARKLVQSLTHGPDERTNPGMVALASAPDPAWYWRGVTAVVDKDGAQAEVKRLKGLSWGLGNRRGVVGSLCACAWPKTDITFEAIAYRKRKKWGTKRTADLERIRQLDEKFPKTFNNYDPANRHAPVVPNTPCPVLWGVRGDSFEELLRVPGFMQGAGSLFEEPEGWCIFESNQGTGDHIVPSTIGSMAEFGSFEIDAIVASWPEEHPGGYVTLRIRDEVNEADAIAYEPTKEFRKVVRALAPGDVIRVRGSARQVDSHGPWEFKRPSMNLEALDVRKLAPVSKGNPRCSACNGPTESMGKGQGLRCKRCGARQETGGKNAGKGDCGKFETSARKPKGTATDGPGRGIAVGTYEVPVCARRHLHRPLSRGKRVYTPQGNDR